MKIEVTSITISCSIYYLQYDANNGNDQSADFKKDDVNDRVVKLKSFALFN